MSGSHGAEPRASGTLADRSALTVSGALLLGGFVVNGIQRMLLHPRGHWFEPPANCLQKGDGAETIGYPCAVHGRRRMPWSALGSRADGVA